MRNQKEKKKGDVVGRSESGKSVRVIDREVIRREREEKEMVGEAACSEPPSMWMDVAHSVHFTGRVIRGGLES
jgi:hypothetical protein